MNETAIKNTLAVVTIACASLYIWNNREAIDWNSVFKTILDTKKDL